MRVLDRRSLARSVGLVGVLIAAVGSAGCLDEPGSWEDGVLLHPDGDVLAAASVVELEETVSGDAMVAGRSVSFDGVLGGSYVGVAGAHHIRGRIDGSVRAVGGSVVVDASVGRNVTVGGGSVELGEDAIVEGNVYVGAGSARVAGRVDGDVYVGAGDVEIEGEIGGDVRVEARSLRVAPGARIGGELRYRLEDEGSVAIAADAELAGGVRALEPREEDDGAGVGFFVLRLLAFVLAGALVVGLLPGTLAATTRQMRLRPAAAFGLGFLWLLLVPALVVAATLTIVGIPLAIIVAVLYLVSLYLAPIVPALWVGGEILHGRDPTERGDAALVFITGGAIVAFAILLPWLGFLARLMATCLGLGGLVLWIRDRRLGPEGEMK